MSSETTVAGPAEPGCERHLWEHDGNWPGPVLKHEYRCTRCGERRFIDAGDTEAYQAMLREGGMVSDGVD